MPNLSLLKNNTHFIIKKEDMKKYLSAEESAKLVELLDKIEANIGHKEYYICNLDEPYANKVLQTILDGEHDKKRINNIDNNKLLSKYDCDKDCNHCFDPICEEEKHTCENCGNNQEYPPPHTCDECTRIDIEEQYSMWTPIIKSNIDKLDFETVPPQWEGRDSKLMWNKINEIIDVLNSIQEKENREK